MPRSTISIPAAPEHVRSARMVAGAAARRGQVPEELLDEVRLAVGESVARSVLRHQRAGIDDPILVTMLDDPESFEVEVDDRAPADLPDEDDGLSAALVESLVPHLVVLPIASGGQRTRMVWPLTMQE